MIDTHCHLNLDPLIKDAELFLDQARKQGITKFIVPGVNRESSQTAIQLAASHPDCFAAIGLHPHEADQVLTDGTDLEAFKSGVIQAANSQQIVAIGECGLDYFRLPEGEQRKHTIKAQHKLFKLHLHLATQTDLPLLVHVRDLPGETSAHTDALNLLSKQPVTAVLHCFSGDATYLQKALDLGFYISFAGNLTFANATDLQTLIQRVPLDRLLLETDAPYLNPMRGEWPNTPANVSQTYQFAADLLNLPLPKLIKHTSHNAKNLFDI